MKKMLLELFEATGQLDPETIVLRLAVATVIAGFIYLSYMLSHEGSIYSKKFNVSLMALTVVTTAVMIVIGNNIAMSLGMVGALSIVRFRSAIKEPVEIVFLFWALAAGIVVGSGLIPLAVIGSAVIGIILLLFGNRKVRENPYILVLNCQDEAAESDVHKALAQMVQHYNVKSKTVTATGIELTAELRAKDASTAFVNSIQSIPGVGSATLVSYNGEYMG